MWKMEISLKRVAVMLAVVLAIVGLVVVFRPPFVMRVVQRLQGKKTVEDRLAEYGPAARSRLHSAFAAKGVKYPPKRLVFVGLKQEKVLQVYADPGDGSLRFIKSYPVAAASGGTGPKLREGDRQVPEGVYKVVFLNPNSLYHLSLRLNYPNDFDREMGEKDGREKLGTDIMIHGSDCGDSD